MISILNLIINKSNYNLLLDINLFHNKKIKNYVFEIFQVKYSLFI